MQKVFLPRVFSRTTSSFVPGTHYENEKRGPRRVSRDAQESCRYPGFVTVRKKGGAPSALILKLFSFLVNCSFQFPGDIVVDFLDVVQVLLNSSK